RRYPGRKVWAVFEPRSNTSRRNIHQQEYAHAFTGASHVTLKTPEKHDQVPDGEGLNVGQLVDALRAQGLAADAGSDVGELVTRVAQGVTPEHVLLVMSNGSFGGFIDKLISQLQKG
ncbi:MAG TPA: UDP-N-acetylmuramate dehydrogenase, partial [Myxococcaceae bacterium]|nr:UDP-N-acetylmuramate dehydrogenase [Myxococcaceae bacterium]